MPPAEAVTTWHLNTHPPCQRHIFVGLPLTSEESIAKYAVNSFLTLTMRVGSTQVPGRGVCVWCNTSVSAH